MFHPPESGSIQESLYILDTVITQQKRDSFQDMASYSPKAPTFVKERLKRFLYNNLKSNDEYLMEIKRKSLLKEKHSNYTILNDAVKIHDPRYVETLIKSGAPLNNPDKNQMTPLEIAIANNNYELCALLLYYGCGRFRSRFSSHLIYAICARSNPDIQLLLLNYEANLNICFLKASLLIVAIKYSQFLIPHLLNCGLDVDFRKTFYFILKNPVPLDYFQLIWDKFDCDDWDNNCSESVLLAALKGDYISNHLWQGYIRKIIEDPRIGRILERETVSIIPFLIQRYYYRRISEHKYYDLICILLSSGCRVDFEHVIITYRLLGRHSFTYKLLKHMEITGLDKDYHSFSQIHFCINKPVSYLLHSFFNTGGSLVLPKDVPEFFAISKSIRKCQTSGTLSSMLHSSSIERFYKRDVPTLLELARNQSREFICMKYKIVNAGQYISIVKHYLNLPNEMKAVLTFESPLYRS